MMRNIVKNIIFLIILLSLFSCTILSSCSVQVENNETIFIPEPANQFAIDKETETSAIEETKAHHIYPTIKLSADAEIVIGEKDFLTKIHHIKENIEKYQNSSIIIEGMYGFYDSWDKTFNFPMVYRNGPGCCGDDRDGGFYLINIDQTAYEIDDWIRVKGKPFIYDHTDSEGEVQKYVFLLVETIEVLTTRERKAEMVNS